MLFWGTVAVCFVGLTGWSLYAKYFGNTKYRGVRIVNWTRAQREEARARRRRWDAEGR
ncbi:MAG: hypothetical protein M3Y77_08660 [Actinomycetota bacterium]|nr:hypothetical protein [Actinomycetota bacterium]